MDKEFTKKCKEIFDTKNEIIVKDEELDFVKKLLHESFTNEYKYIISFYAGVFLKDNYEIYSKYRTPMTDDEGTEPFLYFIGLEGKKNINTVYQQYKDRIQGNYVPIALAEGDNLVCIKRDTGEIGLWIHDDREEPYIIHDSLEEMIMMVKKRDDCEDEDGVVEMVVSDKFLAAVEAFKKGRL